MISLSALQRNMPYEGKDFHSILEELPNEDIIDDIASIHDFYFIVQVLQSFKFPLFTLSSFIYCNEIVTVAYRVTHLSWHVRFP